MNTKILITGGFGFVGGRLGTSLTKCGYEVNYLYRSQRESANNSFVVNMSDFSAMSRYDFAQFTHIFHCAAMINPRKNDELRLKSFQDNFLSTINLVSLCNKSAKFVFFSTDKVYDPKLISADEESVEKIPNLFYAQTKIFAESVIASNFKNYQIFRCPIIHSLGARDSLSFIDAAILKLMSQDERVSAAINVVRNFVNVDDLVGFLSSTLNNRSSGVFNIGSKPMSYFERLKLICSQLKIDDSRLIPQELKIEPLVQTISTTKFTKIFGIHME
jgi:nucleoside-diphosphate-sugar epimerase